MRGEGFGVRAPFTRPRSCPPPHLVRVRVRVRVRVVRVRVRVVRVRVRVSGYP